MTEISEKYWMADEPDVVISHLDEYDTQWRTYQGNPFYDMWYRNSYAYYSTVLDEDSVISALNFRGEKGELVEMKIPQARSLIRQMLTLITKNRLAFQVIAEMNKYNFIKKMRVANALVQQELKFGAMDMVRSLAAEQCLVLGTSYITCLLDFTKGKKIGLTETGGSIFSGEPVIEVCHPTDMLYDFRLPFRNSPWKRLRKRMNRYDLVALYPELQQEILQLPSCWESSAQIDQFFATDNKDDVFVYHLIHEKTPAIEEGRYMVYCDDKTIFYDDVNIYDGVPVEPLIAEPIFTYGVGYAVFSNLLAAQEMYDHDFSAVATNHSNLSIRNFTVARNSDIAIEAMPGGMNLITYTPQQGIANGGAPSVLDMNPPNNDVYTFQDKLLNNMQQMTNINSAIRGEVSAGQSGVSIATLSANAIEFMTGYAMTVQFAIENILYWKFKLLKKIVKEPREISIDMDNGMSFRDYFTGDDIDGVQGIKLIQVNPMMQTQSGRETVANTLLQNGTIKSTQEYISVLDGSPTDRMYGVELSENDYILFEKEMLMRGEVPEAISAENHPRHIREHFSILNNPAARSDQSIRQAVEEHIFQHLRLMKETDPQLMAMAQTGLAPQMPPPQTGGGGAPIPAPEPAPAQATDQPANDLLQRGL